MKTKFYFIWVAIKYNFYKLLCKIDIHPKTVYNYSFKSLIKHKIITLHTCKICNKKIEKNERNY